MTPEKNYDEVVYTMKEAMFYRLSFRRNFLSLVSKVCAFDGQKVKFEDLEGVLNACIKCLEVIKRTENLGVSVPHVFHRSNISGILGDIQIRDEKLPSLGSSVDSYIRTLSQLLAALELRKLNDLMEIVHKFSEINQRHNNFLVSAFINMVCFLYKPSTFCGTVSFEDLIKQEIFKLKAKLPTKANEELEDFYDYAKTIQLTLSYMSTNTTSFYNFLEKNIDFVYFLHVGVISN